MRRTLLTLASLLVTAALVRAGDDPHTFKASTASETLTKEQRDDVGNIEPQGKNGLASYFYGSAQAQIQYTTNAKLQGSNDSSDGVFLPTLRGGFAVPIGAGFSVDLLGRIESALFADNTDRAFWGGSVAGTINWKYKKDFPRLYVSAEPYYFQFYEGSNDISALGLTAGIEHSIVLSRGRTMLFGGYSYSHYFANPSPDDRNTNRFIVGLNQQLHPRIYAQLYYAFAYTAYESFGRHDVRQIGGLNLTYQFNPKLFGTLNSALVDNNSNRDTADYQSFAVSAGMTFLF